MSKAKLYEFRANAIDNDIGYLLGCVDCMKDPSSGINPSKQLQNDFNEMIKSYRIKRLDYLNRSITMLKTQIKRLEMTIWKINLNIINLKMKS